MSDDAIAMEKAKAWAMEKRRECELDVDTVGFAPLTSDLYDAYLAGYAQATSDAKDAVAATIRAEVPERRQGSRSIE